jgi:DNA-binding XRE family transcriptional regulator
MKNDKSQSEHLIGKRLKELRNEHDWTLTDVSQRTGISVATLSKAENGKTDLSFTSVNKLAEGLNLPITDLTSPSDKNSGRRAVTIGGNGVVFSTPDANFEVLCSDMSGQHDCFMKVTIKLRSVPQDLQWHRHSGQEFVYVLKGEIDLHTEEYTPLRLKSGDSTLFDASMGHHYVSRGRSEAVLLLRFSLKGYENVSDLIQTM